MNRNKVFFPQPSQHAAFLTYEIAVIPIFKFPELDPSLFTHPEVKGLQAKLFHAQGFRPFDGGNSTVYGGDVLIERPVIPPALIILEGMGRGSKAQVRGVVPVFLVVP